MAERKVLKYDNYSLTIARPPAGLDPDELIAETMRFRPWGPRYDDASNMEHSIRDYFAACAQGILFPMALRCRDGEVFTSDEGWELRFLSEAYDEMVLAMTSPTRSGAYVVTIDARPQMLPEVRERVQSLEREIEEQLISDGLTPMQAMVRIMMGGGSGKPHDEAISLLKADPASYLPITEESTPCETRIYAVSLPEGGLNGHGLKGPPAGCGDVDGTGVITKREARRGWGPGLNATMFAPDSVPRHKDDPLHEYIMAFGHRDGTFVLPALSLLSEMMLNAGYGPQLQAANEALSTRSWSRNGRIELAELGQVLVYRAGGAIDGSVMEAARSLSHQLASSDLGVHIADFLQLAGGLIAHGHTDRASAFDTNDMRQMSWASEIEGGHSIQMRTQSGTIRLDIRNEAGEIRGARAWLGTDPESAKPIGRFEMRDGRLHPDFDIEPRIPYDVKTIGLINYMTHTLTSVVACFEDEHRIGEEGPSGP